MACCIMASLCVVVGVDVIGGADVFVGVSWMDWFIVGCVVVSISTVVGVGVNAEGWVGAVGVVVCVGASEGSGLGMVIGVECKGWVGLSCFSLVVTVVKVVLMSDWDVEGSVEGGGLWSGGEGLSMKLKMLGYG